MKGIKKLFSHALYFVLPLCFFAVVYFLTAFAVWVFNPAQMQEGIRFFIAIWGAFAMIVGGVMAAWINR